ncbi:MAG: beta-galactosidase, partial [Candidatus Nealsonbacteria bacterium]|nr:beta-galactosidase [Candidatus Nealsonbacteria bacterium]
MIKKMLFIILVFLLIFIGYFFVGQAPQASRIRWGVNFSQKQAENLGLDWRRAYLALIDDLKTKDIKLATYWDLIEPEEGKYNFEDLDWQVKTAQDKGVNLLLVIGMKTPRWPECHIPEWVKSRVPNDLLNYIEKVVNRYKNFK